MQGARQRRLVIGLLLGLAGFYLALTILWELGWRTLL
jgi:hypothetical protein